MPAPLVRFTYVQATGELLDQDGALLGTGYSGRGAGLNNPAMQSVSMTGPLPAGMYTCAKAVEHTRLGPDAVPLAAFPTNKMFGRTGFYCHGDNAHKNHSASEGCIVMDSAARAWLVPGSVLEVVANRPIVPPKPPSVSPGPQIVS